MTDSSLMSHISSSSKLDFIPFSSPHAYSFSLPLIFSFLSINDFHFLQLVTKNEIWISALLSPTACANYQYSINCVGECHNNNTPLNLGNIVAIDHLFTPFEMKTFPLISHFTLVSSSFGSETQNLLMGIQKFLNILNSSPISDSKSIIVESPTIMLNNTHPSISLFPSVHLRSLDIQFDFQSSLPLLLNDILLIISSFQWKRHAASLHRHDMDRTSLSIHSENVCDSPMTIFSFLSSIGDLFFSSSFPWSSHSFRPLRVHFIILPIGHEDNVQLLLSFLSQYALIKEKCSLIGITFSLSIDIRGIPGYILKTQRESMRDFFPFLSYLSDFQVDFSSYLPSPTPIPTTLCFSNLLSLDIQKTFALSLFLPLCIANHFPVLLSLRLEYNRLHHDIYPQDPLSMKTEWNDNDFESLGMMIQTLKRTLHSVTIEIHPRDVSAFPSLFTHLTDSKYSKISNFAIDFTQNIFVDDEDKKVTRVILDSSAVIHSAVDKYFALFPSITSLSIAKNSPLPLFCTPSSFPSMCHIQHVKLLVSLTWFQQSAGEISFLERFFFFLSTIPHVFTIQLVLSIPYSVQRDSEHMYRHVSISSPQHVIDNFYRSFATWRLVQRLSISSDVIARVKSVCHFHHEIMDIVSVIRHFGSLHTLDLSVDGFYWKEREMKSLNESVTSESHPHLTAFSLSTCENNVALSYVFSFLSHISFIRKLKFSMETKEIVDEIDQKTQIHVDHIRQSQSQHADGDDTKHNTMSLINTEHHDDNDLIHHQGFVLPSPLFQSFLLSISLMKNLNFLQLSFEIQSFELLGSDLISILSHPQSWLRSLTITLVGFYPNHCTSFASLLQIFLPLLNTNFAIPMRFVHLRSFFLLIDGFIPNEEMAIRPYWWPLDCLRMKFKDGEKHQCPHTKLVQKFVEMKGERYHSDRQKVYKNEILTFLKEHLEDHNT